MKSKAYIKPLISLLLLFLWAPFGFSQYIYYPYYGKNKVIYENFNWSHYETEHFDIHYYVKDLKILKNIAEMAESAYQRISEDIKHQLSATVPILYYKTSTDFEQTNLFQMPEGVLGVAESVLYRIAIQGDMSPDEIQDLIEHELTHIFEYDLLYGSPGGSLYSVNQPAGWIMEGFAEYSTQTWSSWSSLIVRDAVLNDRIPELNAHGQLYSSYFLPRAPDYDFGHAIFDFIESKYGKNGIREFWHSMKNAPLLGRRNPLRRAFSQDPKQFNHDFKKFLREKHKDFLLRENPEDYSIALGPEFPVNPYYFSLSHTVSPSGDIIAALVVNMKGYDFDIILISTKDGSVIKNLTKGYTLKYEHIKYEIDPAKGSDVAWSPSGDQIAFFARAGQKHSLFLINALNGKTDKIIKIPFDQPSSPCFFPDNGELIFTAFHEGIHDIYKINLATEKILNLTDDDLFEKAPTISPDGQKVAYTIRLDAYDKLFLSPINNLKKKTQLTFGRGNTITPYFTQDSKEIYFSGDMRDAFNIYSLNLETGELKRYSDVRTGNFFPIPLPNEPKAVVFSAFNKGSFQIFKSEFEGETEKTITFVEKPAEEEFERFEPIISLEINKEKIKPYKGMSKLYLTSRPPVDTIVSTDGSLYGGSALSFSDLMGDYTFYLMAYQVRSFRSYYFAFMNQKRRFQYMASAFQYTQFYYGYYGYDASFYAPYLTYRDAIATRKITGISVSAYYPFNRFYRAQGGFGYYNYEEDYLYLLPYANYGQFLNGNILSASFSLVGETTRFNYYGPMSGNTFRLSISQALPVSDSFLRNTTLEADLRQYLYLGMDTLFAFRLEGFVSRGRDPFVTYFGGNNQVRSVYYYSIIATEGWFANAEFRFPLINAALTLIGQIGPVRGVFFFDISRSKIKGYPAKIYDYGSDGRLKAFDAIGSYGYGFEFFLLGIPIHLEFVKKLGFSSISNPWDYDSIGKFQTKFWIGFDF
jgi:Tol biopolymer transport system component